MLPQCGQAYFEVAYLSKNFLLNFQYLIAPIYALKFFFLTTNESSGP